MEPDLTNVQRNLVVSFAQQSFETEEEYDMGDMIAILDEENFSPQQMHIAVDFYFELLNRGPSNMLKKYPNLKWDPDFVMKYDNL